MRREKCRNGHFYDADKFSECPHCRIGVTPEDISPKPPRPGDDRQKRDRRQEAENRLKNAEQLHNETIALIPDAANTAGASIGGEISDPGATVIMLPDQYADGLPEEDVRNAPQIERDLPGGEPQQDEEMEFCIIESIDGEPQAPAEQEAPVPPAEPIADQMEDMSGLRGAVAATNAQAIEADRRSVNYLKGPVKDDRTVGWIVALNGEYTGTSFVVKSGKNRVGRSGEMDISLPLESSVDNTCHAIVIYDPLNAVFYVQNGEGNGLVHLNNELVVSYAELHSFDRIMLGDVEFVFVALCGEHFKWTK